jgi:hypothetical protein
MDSTDKKAVAAIASASAAAAGLGSVTVAVITSTAPAWGPLGWLGLTTVTVTTVALPVAGVVAAAGAATWGAYRVARAVRRSRTERRRLAGPTVLQTVGPVAIPVPPMDAPSLSCAAGVADRHGPAKSLKSLTES